MKLIFLGAPGAGKGTIAKILKDNVDIPQISTGDIFRKAIKDKTPLGLQVTSILEKGELVPDELTISLVKERVKDKDCANGYILDGFPRTIAQAEAWESFDPADAAVYFDISDDEVKRRLSGRRTCPNCQAIFHIENNKPKKEGICDKCGTALIIRSDDAVEAVKNRLDVYHAQTKPVHDYYLKKNKVLSVDATKSPKEVYDELKSKL